MSDENANEEKKKLSEFEARILMSILSLHVSIVDLYNEISRTQICVSEALIADNKSEAIQHIHDLVKKSDIDLSRTKEIINEILEKYEP